jgi:hypothetical protein
MDKEQLMDALNDLCVRVGQIKDNNISEIVFNEVDEVHQDFKELIENINKDQ